MRFFPGAMSVRHIVAVFGTPQCKHLWHRIETAPTKRLAACQAKGGKDAATGTAEAGDSDACVRRATRLEAAAPAQERTERAPVQLEQEQDDSVHAGNNE